MRIQLSQTPCFYKHYTLCGTNEEQSLAMYAYVRMYVRMYDTIYLLIVIGLSPGGSSTIYIYT
jgi:hypothetical protein